LNQAIYKGAIMNQLETFKKNGGYFIDGVAYMDCRETGEPVANVSTNAVSVMGSRAVMHKCLSLMTDNERDKLFGKGSSSSKTTGRPRGWRWMKEFVDSEGNVYHKGVEQPKLKGKRQITDVDAIRKQRLAAKEVKRKKETKKLIKMAAEKKELKKAIEAQKDFLNHKVKK
tara:strand:- start:2682 stop:3194 length:513 start_codon:yes stop_codon:yes gene_type:complete